MEVLSKTQTQAAARTLLTLLEQPELKAVRVPLLVGLDRIGDPAVDEVLDWEQRGAIDDDLLFEVITEVSSPAATRALWTRYATSPPLGRELRWGSVLGATPP